VIDGIPVLVGRSKIARIKRGKRPRPPMAELGIAKLSKRQKQALVNKFELGMTDRRAGIQAGYSVSGATHLMPKLLSRKPIINALDARGITDDRIAQKIDEGLEAMHPFRPEQPDHAVRVRFVSETNKLRDNYPAKKVEVEAKVVNLHLSRDDYSALKKFEELRRK